MRRIITIYTMLLSSIVIFYLLFRGDDTRLHETMAEFAWISLIGVGVAYKVVATWDGKSAKKT